MNRPLGRQYSIANDLRGQMIPKMDHISSSTVIDPHCRQWLPYLSPDAHNVLLILMVVPLVSLVFHGLRGGFACLFEIVFTGGSNFKIKTVSLSLRQEE